MSSSFPDNCKLPSCHYRPQFIFSKNELFRSTKSRKKRARVHEQDSKIDEDPVRRRFIGSVMQSPSSPVVESSQPYASRLRPRTHRVCYALSPPPTIRRGVRKSRRRSFTEDKREPPRCPLPNECPGPNEDGEWMVNQIVDKHDDGNGNIRYRVLWSGFPASTAT